MSNLSPCVCASRELEIAEDCRECLFVLRVLPRRHAENIILLTGAYAGSPVIAHCNALFRDYIDLMALYREKWIFVLPVSLIHTIVAEFFLRAIHLLVCQHSYLTGSSLGGGGAHAVLSQ